MSEPYNADSDAGDEWGTPPKYVEPLSDVLDGFDLDPASGAEPQPYADERYTVEDDGLSTPWYGDVWLNPPYGRSANKQWAKRTVDQWQNEDVETITALVPASTDTQWFQNNYFEANYLTFIEGRIEFLGDGDNNATFPSVIASFGTFPEEYLSALNEMGVVTERKSF